MAKRQVNDRVVLIGGNRDKHGNVEVGYVMDTIDQATKGTVYVWWLTKGRYSHERADQLQVIN